MSYLILQSFSARIENLIYFFCKVNNKKRKPIGKRLLEIKKALLTLSA